MHLAVALSASEDALAEVEERLEESEGTAHVLQTELARAHSAVERLAGELEATEEARTAEVGALLDELRSEAHVREQSRHREQQQKAALLRQLEKAEHVSRVASSVAAAAAGAPRSSDYALSSGWPAGFLR